MKPTKTGYLPSDGHRIYYEIYGKASATKTPLLVLHGGPGSAHNYMLGLAKLADEDRQVIFYDQLGCGLSDHPDDDSLWTVKTFIKEVAAVREALHLTDIHLLGHSWGGMLAIEYLLTKPTGVHSAVLASAMISMPLYQAEVETLKQALPVEVYLAMIKHEAAGTTDSASYQRAYAEYTKRHLFRGQQYPPEFSAPAGTQGDAAYYKMWGPSEAYADGTMRNWDMIPRLPEISIPTLVISGEYDELTPHQAEITHEAIPGSQLAIIAGGSHLAHIEHVDEYVERVDQFLSQVEANAK